LVWANNTLYVEMAKAAEVAQAAADAKVAREARNAQQAAAAAKKDADAKKEAKKAALAKKKKGKDDDDLPDFLGNNKPVKKGSKKTAPKDSPLAAAQNAATAKVVGGLKAAGGGGSRRRGPEGSADDCSGCTVGKGDGEERTGNQRRRVQERNDSCHEEIVAEGSRSSTSCGCRKSRAHAMPSRCLCYFQNRKLSLSCSILHGGSEEVSTEDR
jgi:hypothetical protein